ncbi:MAG: M23 family metallopeptidase [candidate division KSB1 bacterium]|nr:M23 family metallopeptidase [candidate division KSB1 bacterium]MDZ7300738.1 M23 family metallopeptidase [candidate division KSB1 bacterium]MDZ7309992.1 M23 family metallopeptidase [candidate division KSB1 bacterium]
MKGSLCFVLLLTANLSTFAQGYLWPTDASQFITSSFGESRPRRFHAAIDIKTWNQVGYKVFAVRSGYIERMAISPFGYGRVLYHRLDTGETAVYAHLEAFNDKLQAIAEQEQERVGRYRINKFFRPGILPVQQGEVIGYTGQSGIGTPHLHFELRDARNRPLNPFLRGFKIADTIAPMITALAVSPLEPGAMVNGDFLPLIFRPARHNGQWRIVEPIHISGKVGFAIDGYDQANGVNNRFAFYRLQLFIDDTLQFQAQFDRFDYSQNELVELDRDFLLWRRDLGNFHRLYRVSGNTLGFYSFLNLNDGAILSWPDSVNEAVIPKNENLRPAFTTRNPQSHFALHWGPHRLRVVAQDFFGNRSIVDADLLVGPPFPISLQGVEAESTRLKIKFVHLPPNRKVQRLEAAVADSNSRMILSPWHPVAVKWGARNSEMIKAGTFDSVRSADTLGISSNTSAGSDWQQGSVLELQTGGAQLVRLVAIDQHGLRSHPAFVFAQPFAKMQMPLLLTVERDFYPNYLRLLIQANQPLAGVPSVRFVIGSKILQAECIPQQPNRYIASVPLAEIAGDSVQLEVVAENLSGQQETWRDWFMNALVPPGWGRSLFAADARMRVAFPEQSVYWPLYGRVQIDSVTHIEDSRVIGPIYHVEPQDVPLRLGATVTISYPDTIAQPRQLGVCYRNRHRWVFIDNKLNTAIKTVSARVFSLEDFAIIRDDAAPSLNIRSPRDGSVMRDRRPLISVDVEDSTSGFESEEAIELRLDGQKLIAEYDPERDLVQYRPRKDLTLGVHTLAVRAEDRCGNVARQEAKFTVR